MSIKPVHCQNILEGKKKVELRRRVPNCKLPYTVFVYCTKEEKLMYIYPGQEREVTYLDGHIIGKFKVNKVSVIHSNNYEEKKKFAELACVSTKDLALYAHGDDIYALHIDEFVAFSKPLTLDDFRKPCIDEYGYCPFCKLGGESVKEWVECRDDLTIPGAVEWYCINFIKKPPQSWCYCELFYNSRYKERKEDDNITVSRKCVEECIFSSNSR